MERVGGVDEEFYHYFQKHTIKNTLQMLLIKHQIKHFNNMHIYSPSFYKIIHPNRLIIIKDFYPYISIKGFSFDFLIDSLKKKVRMT